MPGCGANQIYVLVMSVPIERETHDVLVSLNQCLETTTKLVQEVMRLDVTGDIGNTTICFNFSKLSLEPANVVCRVIFLP